MINFSKFNSIISLTSYFTSDAKCMQAIIESRWGVGEQQDVVCPYCGKHHCKMSKNGRFHCTECNCNFSIYGDIVDIDDSSLAQTLKGAIVPKELMNVVLVYNLANRTMSFTSKKSGLIIKPEDEGEDGWSRLLGLVGDFNSAYMKTAR